MGPWDGFLGKHSLHSLMIFSLHLSPLRQLLLIPLDMHILVVEAQNIYWVVARFALLFAHVQLEFLNNLLLYKVGSLHPLLLAQQVFRVNLHNLFRWSVGVFRPGVLVHLLYLVLDVDSHLLQLLFYLENALHFEDQLLLKKHLFVLRGGMVCLLILAAFFWWLFGVVVIDILN